MKSLICCYQTHKDNNNRVLKRQAHNLRKPLERLRKIPLFNHSAPFSATQAHAIPFLVAKGRWNVPFLFTTNLTRTACFRANYIFFLCFPFCLYPLHFSDAWHCMLLKRWSALSIFTYPFFVLDKIHLDRELQATLSDMFKIFLPISHCLQLT